MYDVIVIGGGHGGCEAAVAASGMGCKTLLVTMNINTIALMSCNPAIGGLAKGHLVKEMDAMGGEMAKAIDAAGIQFKMLNSSKGPAVWSPRAQADRVFYAAEVKRRIEKKRNLTLKEGTVNELLIDGNRAVGVKTNLGQEYEGKAVIITAGTFLNGIIHIGMKNFPGGRAGEYPAVGLTEQLKKLGIRSERLKTGTPPRLDGKTVNFDVTAEQPGDGDIVPFSYQTELIEREQVSCYLTYTNSETHKILFSGFDRSPLYTGVIKSKGPRYCPSVETKIVRFKDKERHQIFLEPEGRDSSEYYVNGFATSLPEDIQIKAIRSIAGLEKAEITRFGYAIEYDYFPTNQLKFTLETKKIENLYLAGQVNGTSGYEEAGTLGFMAGVNAALKIHNEKPFILKRSEAYIGVLIDDLVTKGTDEPYRMFTSRAEYRLLLRQDNADERLMHYGHRFGLIPDEVFHGMNEKVKERERIISIMKKGRVKPEEINPVLRKAGSSPVEETTSIVQILKRPDIGILDIREFIPESGDRFERHASQIEMEIKYKGYIDRQIIQAEQMKKLDDKNIPDDIDYNAVVSIRAESREKLIQIRPDTIGQASRIPGVTPADISVLLIHLKKVGAGAAQQKEQ
ncbi:tRNA uridine-5-carboxymethylaminomethyl(34) synthesis enzyme MnmG [bacterium]|nr:tRNA uridine-5-carboxymethylaminomethyl(34) synthesis enzyme MnmG [bacterium]